jgi:hypothetical protein
VGDELARLAADHSVDQDVAPHRSLSAMVAGVGGRKADPYPDQFPAAIIEIRIQRRRRLRHFELGYGYLRRMPTKYQALPATMTFAVSTSGTKSPKSIPPQPRRGNAAGACASKDPPSSGAMAALQHLISCRRNIAAATSPRPVRWINSL